MAKPRASHVGSPRALLSTSRNADCQHRPPVAPRLIRKR
jgi:hypothetical protein